VVHPILVTCLNLQRGDGKTFNAVAYVLANMFKTRNKSFAFACASEDQGKALFVEHYKSCITQDPVLARMSVLRGNGFTVPKRNSRFEVLASSHRSATGRRRTHIVFEEAKEIEARMVSAVLPTVASMHGIECPSGHVRISPDEMKELKSIPTTCNICRQRLTRWWPRIIAVSSSGVKDDSERMWFHELLTSLQAEPDPSYHCFQSFESLNPAKSETVTDALSRRFGSLASMRSYAASEFGNQWTEKGDETVSQADVKRCMDKTLENEGTSAPCIGFLDTSTVGDKTSIVILADAGGPTLWENVYQPLMQFWEPAKSPRRVIDPEEVFAFLCDKLPMFPGLVGLHVDQKVGATKDQVAATWPVAMMRKIRTLPNAWSKKVKVWTHGRDESDQGWDFLIERLILGTIRLQYSDEVLKEFRGVETKTPKTGDRKSRVVDKNRRHSHKDITESLADTCFLIQLARFNKRQAYTFTGSDPLRKVLSAPSNKIVTNKIATGRFSGDWT
jgi:hypothetical protein